MFNKKFYFSDPEHSESSESDSSDSPYAIFDGAIMNQNQFADKFIYDLKNPKAVIPRDMQFLIAKHIANILDLSDVNMAIFGLIKIRKKKSKIKLKIV